MYKIQAVLCGLAVLSPLKYKILSESVIQFHGCIKK